MHQYTWSRQEQSGQRGERRKKLTQDKESQRWRDTLTAAEQGIDQSVGVVHLGDREADISALVVPPRRSNSQLLIRAAPNRQVQHELDYLMPTIEQAPVLGQQTIEIERHPQRPARSAT